MTVDLKRLTEAEYLSLPALEARSSSIDGALVMDAAPTPDHQTILQELFVRLDSLMRALRLGRVFPATLDIVIRRDPPRSRQPDLMFISTARGYSIGRQVIESGPDLVIEILSPSHTRRAVEAKLQDYQSIDVREAWVASPEGRTVEVLQLPSESIARSGLYGLGDLIVSQVLPELRLMVDEIFPELYQCHATAIGKYNGHCYLPARRSYS
jgi:Uma2 family endonuclease